MKDKIIEKATELFMSKGYLATSTRDIVKELNITQPALYHHYKNKELIYIEVLSRFAVNTGKGLIAVLNSDQDDNTKLINMSLYLKNHHPFNLSLMMHDMHKELSIESRIQLFQLWKKFYLTPFVTYFESIQDKTSSELNPSILTRHFLTSISAYINDHEPSHTMESLRIEDYIRIFLYGIKEK